MSRYRLLPSVTQEAVLREHCAHARFVWNLACEQQSWYRPGRASAPGYLQQCRELTAARREHAWLGVGSQMVQQLSTGELLRSPRLSPARQRRLRLLERRVARAKRGSNRRARTRIALARLKARQADSRKDWCEQISTDLARRFDLIRVEGLRIRNMTRSARGTAAHPGQNVRQKAGLNREILASAWGLLVNAARNLAAGLAVTARGGDGDARPVNREPQHGGHLVA